MEKRITRGKAIVLMCRECMGYDGWRGGESGVPYQKAGIEVAGCEDVKCPLWRFRTGKEVDGPSRKIAEKTTTLVDSDAKKRSRKEKV